jgi:hypothetical protein
MHSGEFDASGGVGESRGKVEDAAAADRGELVPVTDQDDAHIVLVRHSEECGGGVLVEHSGLIHEKHIAAPELRFRFRAAVLAL